MRVPELSSMSSGLCPFLNVQGFAASGSDIWQDRRHSRVYQIKRERKNTESMVVTTIEPETGSWIYTIVSGPKTDDHTDLV